MPSNAGNSSSVYEFLPSAEATRLHFIWRDWPGYPNARIPGPYPDPGNNVCHPNQYCHGTGIPRALPCVLTFEERDRDRLPHLSGLGKRVPIAASDKAKDVLVKLAPKALDIAEAETVSLGYGGKERPGPRFWVIDVVQWIKAVQPSAATAWERPGPSSLSLWPRSAGSGNEQFARSEIGDSVIWREFYRPMSIHCTDALKTALTKARVAQLVLFRKVGEIV